PNRTRKSIAAERTFSENIASEIQMLEKLDKIADDLEKRLKKSEIKGKTITLKIKYRDFEQQTRSRTLADYFDEKEVFFPVIEELIYQDKMKESVRLLGLSVTNLNNKEEESKETELSVQLKFDFEW
ncbi:MAG: DNA polymerase IV, partial [Flavobacteriales bacterium]|nr:DNA polymerase IV [Flavobacteriales bacterium]